MDEKDLREHALEIAVNIAPKFVNLKQVGAAVNEVLGVDWNEGVWTGIFRRKPEVKEQVLKVLGTQTNRSVDSVVLSGNVKGAVISDVHAPYHDKNAVRLMIKVLS